MMKQFILVATFLLLVKSTNGQTPFITRDSLNINNINASVLLHGDMWWAPNLGIAECGFPSGSGKNIGFASSLWMSGYDDGGTLHIAAQTYRQTGMDYWPGPMYPTDTLTYATSSNWAKFWKVYRTDIQTFLAIGTHTTTNTPASILNWPGKGNTYATGAGGVSLTVSTAMAPFVDLNANGIYEPLFGEYPDFNGDEAIWWVFSDNGPTHTETGGRPLGIEVHVMSYGYKRNTLIDNVVYYDYTIINRSANNYHNFRFTQWADMDLGYYNDDFIGFDTVHRMGIIYNGAVNDGAGVSTSNKYGTQIPIAGVTMISFPGDSGSSIVPAGSFTYYVNSSSSIIGNPTVDTQYNNYMRAKVRNGEHLSNDYQGPGVPCAGYGLGPNVNYIYTGNPGILSGWTECGCNNIPGDRRFIISSNDLTLPAGSVNKLTMALVTTYPDSPNACPGASFDSLFIYTDTAWSVFFNPLPPIPMVVEQLGISGNIISVYPNPAVSTITVTGAGNICKDGFCTIINSMGKKYLVPASMMGLNTEINVENLPQGVYMLQTVDEKSAVYLKFFKEQR